MANSEITSVRENMEAKAASNPDSDPDSDSETTMENSATKDVHNKSNRKWPTKEEFFKTDGQYLLVWNIIFLISCVSAVLLDPLFLYIPIINEDMKCLKLDKNLRTIALVLRSVTDLAYVMNIFLQVRRNWSTGSPVSSNLKNIAKKMRQSHLLIDILAVLPLPQVVILIFFSKMRRSGFFSSRKPMNILVLVQYVPRVFRIYLLCKELRNASKLEEIGVWVKGVLNFFLYILASHVLGAFWYFFAIQRITICWKNACRKENGCEPSNFDCHDHHTLRNITFLNDLCPIDPENPKIQDFGLFLDILQAGILGSTNYSEKFTNCFWWGLRNLSSLGSNLVPSTNAWENIFAALISIIGLLLFLYLIGNLQTYMSLETERIESHRWKMNMENSMRTKGEQVDKWLSVNGIPLSKKSDIMEMIRLKYKESTIVDVDDENLVPILPEELRKQIRRCSPLSRLKQVRLHQRMDDQLLEAISKYLKPKTYPKNHVIIHEKKRLRNMIFIVHGNVIIEKEHCSTNLRRGEEEYYGEKLLAWPFWTSFPELPLSTETVKADDGIVEALVLRAKDIEKIVSDRTFSLHLESEEYEESKWEVLTSDWLTMLKKVPVLEDVNERVVREICNRLQKKPYAANELIIEQYSKLEMIFVVKGRVLIKRDDCFNYLTRVQGEFYGQELLAWPSSTSLPDQLPFANDSIRASDESSVEVLVLTTDDMKSIALPKNIALPKESKSDLLDYDRLTWLRKVPLFRTMDEQVLKAISEHIKVERIYNENVGKYLIRRNQPIEKMFFIVEGKVQIEGLEELPKDLGGGEFFGEELVEWVQTSQPSFPAKLPLSTSSVEVNSIYVTFLTLRADDLRIVIAKFWLHFKQVIKFPSGTREELLNCVRVTLRKQFPEKDEQELKAMSEKYFPIGGRNQSK